MDEDASWRGPTSNVLLERNDGTTHVRRTGDMATRSAARQQNGGCVRETADGSQLHLKTWVLVLKGPME